VRKIGEHTTEKTSWHQYYHRVERQPMNAEKTKTEADTRGVPNRKSKIQYLKSKIGNWIYQRFRWERYHSIVRRRPSSNGTVGL